MRASLREELRAATRSIHHRLHRHPGLSAAARGEISLRDYRRLLMRLYGFHRAFEDAHASAGQRLRLFVEARAEFIALDLAALGTMRADVSRLPLCEFRQPSNEAAALGALYVVAGSALGGALIAQALAPIVGEARRFFLGGPSRRDHWSILLTRMETLTREPQRVSAVEAAVETFQIFENWMQDWGGAPFSPRALAEEEEGEARGGAPI